MKVFLLKITNLIIRINDTYKPRSSHLDRGFILTL